MGSSPSKSIEDISSADIAAFVASLGNNFKAYEAAILESNVSGKELAGMTDDELEQILDSLCVTNRLHRRKLTSVCKKQLKTNQTEEGECDTCSTTSSSYSAASPPRHSLYGPTRTAAEAPRLAHFNSSAGQATFASDDCSVAGSVSPVPAPKCAMPGQFENMCVANSHEALSLLVNMENEKRLLSLDSRPSGPPEGKAAIVLTDVQGSTALWEADPQAMRAALNMHDDIIRALRADHGGYEIDTEGDAFFLAFHSAKDALTFALSLQEALRDADWDQAILSYPEACESLGNRGLRVRMAIHWGPVTMRRNAVTGRLEYTGKTMDKAREVEGMADGGQILTTRSTFDAASIAARIEDRGNDIVQVLCAQRRSATRRRTSLGSSTSLCSKDGSGSVSKRMSQGRQKRRSSMKKSISSANTSALSVKPRRRRPHRSNSMPMPKQNQDSRLQASAVAALSAF